ncbi:hypothetical protein CspeluHIS016_0111800 [Cutaneotrichosporon spelunceum]|uniref:[histone H3]-trimethyl-L-lysine(9) demethylase n=1 Tax=Cutaneotrichosporon spelunceum TaxID=1672016 RepID=A0AAD3YAC8_9TREE|nr:hypothetical protein CspeluHIS016_0111800 [Cutaneotrichosporon spelunceum]
MPSVPPLPAISDVARPAYFFPLNNNPKKSMESEPEPIPDDLIVLPDDDPGALAGIPVFKPTYDEFKDFDVYMERVAPWGQRSSIVKIIPPKEWVDTVNLIGPREMSELQIRSPIEQQMLGQNGVFVQRNIERNRNRPLSVKEWFKKCSHHDFLTPDPRQGDRTVDRDSKDARAWRHERAAAIKAEKIAKREAALKRKQERDAKKAEEQAAAERANHDSSSFGTPPGSQNGDDDLPGLEVSSHSSPSDVDPFYETVDFKKDWLPAGTSQDDFTVSGCANLEKKFWKSIGMARSSWYGADLAGSLFADPKTPWNVAHLPNLLQRIKDKLPGVNTPYLYFGMWRAAFSWHVEDMDLFSINYIHFGAPKFWYAVPQADADRFETVTRSYFSNDANGCDQFMRHKSCTLSPTKLAQEGIRVNKLVHFQNEFVITFPRGYHAGFNMGFNCAESVNFALPYWLEIGKRAKACTCVNFSVRIDVDRLLQSPSPSPEMEIEEAPKRPRKRKSTDAPTPRQPRVRRRRQEASSARPSVAPSEESPLQVKVEEPAPPPKLPVIRLRIPQQLLDLSRQDKPKSSITRDAPKPPCVLCPSLATDDLAAVFQPSDMIRAMSSSSSVNAHVSCAIAVPEAYTEDFDVGEGSIVTYIRGLDDIGKDRWKLKCAHCVDKRSATTGTKIQCTKGKCLRAYHIPCARNDPQVSYWAGEKVVNGTPTFSVELLCPTHNPAVVEMKKRMAQDELRRKVLGLKEGTTVKIKSSGGSYEVMLVGVDEATSTVLVQVADGTRKPVSWTSLDFHAQQPRMLENEYAGPPKRNRSPVARPPAPVRPPTAPGGVGKIDLGLDRMRDLMRGLPPMTVPAVHLAGTNGKGSVSALMESCFRAAGFRTARYNSPHLLEARDAVRIDGLPPSREQYAEALMQVERTARERNLEPTTFEVATAAFFYLASTAQPPVDVMIVECGMGGARDATNVMPDQIILASGLTSVGLDHTDRLGSTIGEIAREKASILVEGAVLVTSPELHPEATSVAHAIAAERGAHFVPAAPSSVLAPQGPLSLTPFREPAPSQIRTPLAGTAAKYLDTSLGLGGAHQLDNLSLALTMLDVMRHDRRALYIQPRLSQITEAHMIAGVANTRWEGRCSWLAWRDGDVSVPILADGAHNADSAATLRAYIDSLNLPSRPRTFILSLSANPGKTPKSVLAPLLRPGDRIALVDFTTPVEGMPWIRPADKGAVRAAAEALQAGEIVDIPGAGPPALANALRWAQSDWNVRGPGLTVVCGSLYLVADAYRLIGA